MSDQYFRQRTATDFIPGRTLATSEIVLILTISLLLGWWSTTGTKSQFVRLLDIFVYGPFLIWIGWQLHHRGEGLTGLVLVAMGGSTLTYNLRNYLVQQK